MKNVIRVLIMVMVLCFVAPISIEAKPAKTDYQIVKTLVKSTHKPMKLVKYNNKKSNFIISHRKGKNYIVVEKIISTSRGNKSGLTSDGYYIAYNKKVPKGRLVTSYIIYAPNSNEFDEILWVVDNGTYR